MLIHKKTYEMARYISYSCAINMVLNVWLIPRMGLQGAALATLLACAFLMALMGWRSHQVLPLRFNFVGMLRYILAASAAALVSMRLELQHPVLNFLAKGTAFVLLYAGFLWLIDGNFRKLASSGTKLLRAETPVAAGAWKPVSDEVQSSVDSLPAGR
jgi:O-antigen/teichoic acid export membrane protein